MRRETSSFARVSHGGESVYLQHAGRTFRRRRIDRRVCRAGAKRRIKKICKILPPAYAAPDLSDSSAWVVIAEVEGEFNPQTEADEYIRPLLADRKQLEKLLETEKFSGRAQLMAYFFSRLEKNVFNSI